MKYLALEEAGKLQPVGSAPGQTFHTGLVEGLNLWTCYASRLTLQGTALTVKPWLLAAKLEIRYR